MSPELIIEEARSWIGTPWQHQAMVKGHGVDCAMFLVGVCYELGMVDDEDLKMIPAYPRDWHFHNKESQLIPLLEQFPVFEIPVQERQPGDILVFKVANCESHLGLLTSEDWFVHAFTSSSVKKVLELPLDEKWVNRLTRVYRFEEIDYE